MHLHPLNPDNDNIVDAIVYDKRASRFMPLRVLGENLIAGGGFEQDPDGNIA